MVCLKSKRRGTVEEDKVECFLFRALLEKKNTISLFNRLQPVTVIFLTLINKFSDRYSNKVKLVAFLEILES